MSAEPIPGSFRDPNARVYRTGDRILRALHGEAVAAFRSFASSPACAALRERSWLIGFDDIGHPDSLPPADAWVEHPNLPVISHAQEWPFAILREAALFHLDVQLLALEHGFKLRDASAYNVQFDRGRPVFIDLPSFAPYVEGEHWHGHRQFCEQFLNPLLLRARFGIPHHAWLRGAPDGIPVDELYELCRWRDWFSPYLLTHVVLPVRLQRWAAGRTGSPASKARALPRSALRSMIGGLRGWIGSLEPGGNSRTTWSNYETDNTYEADAREHKHRLIRDFVAGRRPDVLLDVGCNSGEYSQIAIEGGASQVVGVDSDLGALDAACQRRTRGKLPMLPLYMDAANPSPAQGWRHREFPAFRDRMRFDAVLALAVAHHLALGRNIPLDEVIGWIVSLAPAGFIEFVPKTDPTARRMLSLKGDIFPNYDEGRFRAHLGAVARIVSAVPAPGSGRVVFEFLRDDR